MHSLVHRVKTLTEHKFHFLGGGAVRITRARLSAHLSESGLESAAFLDEGSLLPRSLAEDLAEDGRVSGIVRSEPSDDPAMALVKRAFAYARKEARGWSQAELIAEFATDYPDDYEIRLRKAVSHIAQSYINEAVVKTAYEACPAKPSMEWALPTKSVFVDILADIVEERMSKGISKYKRGLDDAV